MIFVATLTYALGKQLGFESATAEFNRQVAKPDSFSLPCARLIGRLRAVDDVAIYHDASATCLGKARSRAAFAALQANADVAIFVDDDVECDANTVANLLDVVCHNEDDVVCVAPCVTRGSNVVNVAFPADPVVRSTKDGTRTVQIVSGGFGLVAMLTKTLRRIVEQHPDLHFRDDDGALKPAIFFDLLIGELWLGEDVSFCYRTLAAGVRLEALASGLTMHAGQPFRLDELGSLAELRKPYEAPTVRDATEAEAQRFNRG